MPRINLIQYRRGSAAAWATANPTLASGEVGFATDTNELRIGNGATPWLALEPIGVVSESAIETAVDAYLVANPPSGATDGDVAAFVADESSATHAAVVAVGGTFTGDSDDIPQGSSHFFLSESERTKLSGIQEGAQVNAVTSVAGKSGDVALAAADVSAMADLSAGGTVWRGAVAYADRPLGLVNDGRLHLIAITEGWPE